jgi:hypothetical protein
MTRKQNARLRDKFFTTSSAIQSIYPWPSAGDSTRILRQNGGALVGKKESQDMTCPLWKSQGLLHRNDNEQVEGVNNGLKGPSSPTNVSLSSRLSATHRTKLLEMTLKNAQNKYSNSRDQRFADRGKILQVNSSPRGELSKQKQKAIANRLSIGRDTKLSV